MLPCRRRVGFPRGVRGCSLTSRFCPAARSVISATILVSSLVARLALSPVARLQRDQPVNSRHRPDAALRVAFAENPNGIQSFSPRLRGTSYLGTSFNQIIYRNAVASPVFPTDATCFVVAVICDRRKDVSFPESGSVEPVARLQRGQPVNSGHRPDVASCVARLLRRFPGCPDGACPLRPATWKP